MAIEKIKILGAIFTQPVQTLFLFKSIWTRSQGSQGCQKIRISFLQIKLLSLCAKIALKRHKLQKTVRIEKKNVKKTLFYQSILNILQFGGNISAPNLKWQVQWTLAHVLTPQGPLEADPYRIYQGFSICF